MQHTLYISKVYDEAEHTHLCTLSCLQRAGCHAFIRTPPGHTWVCSAGWQGSASLTVVSLKLSVPCPHLFVSLPVGFSSMAVKSCCSSPAVGHVQDRWPLPLLCPEPATAGPPLSPASLHVRFISLVIARPWQITNYAQIISKYPNSIQMARQVEGKLCEYISWKKKKRKMLFEHRFALDIGS